MIGSKIEVVKYAPTDPRLGRHVEHDNRSKQFAFLGKRLGHPVGRPEHQAGLRAQGRVA